MNIIARGMSVFWRWLHGHETHNHTGSSWKASERTVERFRERYPTAQWTPPRPPERRLQDRRAGSDLTSVRTAEARPEDYEPGGILASYAAARAIEQAVQAYPTDVPVQPTAFDGGRSGGAGAGASWDEPTPVQSSAPEPVASFESSAPTFDQPVDLGPVDPNAF